MKTLIAIALTISMVGVAHSCPSLEVNEFEFNQTIAIEIHKAESVQIISGQCEWVAWSNGTMSVTCIERGTYQDYCFNIEGSTYYIDTKGTK